MSVVVRYLIIIGQRCFIFNGFLIFMIFMILNDQKKVVLLVFFEYFESLHDDVLGICSSFLSGVVKK